MTKPSFDDLVALLRQARTDIEPYTQSMSGEDEYNNEGVIDTIDAIDAMLKRVDEASTSPGPILGTVSGFNAEGEYAGPIRPTRLLVTIGHCPLRGAELEERICKVVLHELPGDRHGLEVEVEVTA